MVRPSEEFFAAAKAEGTYVFSGDGSAVQENVEALHQFCRPDGTVKSNIPDGELNVYGGDHDLTAW